MVRTAEALGFDSFRAPDHPMGGHDSWATLATVAAATTRHVDRRCAAGLPRQR
jgi:alkanesulfonate monooxygenase SsuD/methylene tetrahydromethanopterin reductase-like flavin-dependent oxidoreductase (luciferase family)